MSLVCRSCRFFQVVARCVQRQVPSTVAVHQHGRHLPFRGAEAYPHDQAVQQTIEIPLLPYTRWLMSLFIGRADFPCRGAEAATHHHHHPHHPPPHPHPHPLPPLPPPPSPPPHHPLPPVFAGPGRQGGRSGGLLLPPFPHGLCVGGQKEGGGEEGGEEAFGWARGSCSGG